MDKKTVIFSLGGGRLANQLLNAAHFYAWAIEKQKNIIVLPFWQFSKQYPATAELYSTRNINGTLAAILNSFLRVSVPLSSNNFRKALKTFNFALRTFLSMNRKNLIIRIKDYTDPRAPLDSLDLNDSTFNKKVDQSSSVLISGWNIRNWDLVEKHSSTLRRLFQPSHAVLEAGDELLSNLKKDGNRVIGLFIRKGDYKYWLNGRFYFENSRYAHWIRQIKQEYSTQPICFLISCEEKLDFNDLDYEHLLHFSNGSANKGGTPFQTLNELSKCDILFSVPSTFAAWAAFIGNIPLIPLSEETINFNDKIVGLKEAANHDLFKIAVN